MSEKETMAFIKNNLSKYYNEADIHLPERFSRREFAFFYYDSETMHRPVGFKRREDAINHMTSHSPAHVYYSAAYYKEPSVPMAEKKWLGADLIFDLDADHVKGAEKLPYAEQLAEVKRRFIYLVDEFLLKDFVPEKDMQIVFSGGRGYHAHIRGEKILQLGSHERREIVDYITGTGLDINLIFPEKVFDVRSFRGYISKKGRREFLPGDSKGWWQRVVNGIYKTIERWEKMSEEEVIEELRGIQGIGGVKARKLYDELFVYERLKGGELGVVDEKGKIITKRLDRVRGIDKLRDKTIEYGETSDFFVKLVVENMSLHEAAETDEPVTSDVKRLIRMPTSVHGKSGLVALPLSRDELDGFEPLRDAFPKTFSDRSTKVNVLKQTYIKLKDETFNLRPGLTEVPEFAAMFLLCRGVAELTG